MNISKVTKILLDIMFYSGILITLGLTWILKPYGEHFDPYVKKYLYSLVAILTLCGIFGLLIVWELRKIFKTVLNDQCFILANVTSLNRMAIYSFLISFLMLLLNIFLYVTLASLTMILVFLIAGLFSRVLAQVFGRAVSYKEETDFTI
jgi:uncharacterized Tic20 family protein